MSLIAVVRVRAKNKMSYDEEFALDIMHLPCPNSCSLLEDNPTNRGMVHRMQGVLTWGDVSDEVVTALRKKAKDPKATHFRLNPPRKGYGRKGNKIQYTAGGALGERKAGINDLLKRMVA